MGNLNFPPVVFTGDARLVASTVQHIIERLCVPDKNGAIMLSGSGGEVQVVFEVCHPSEREKDGTPIMIRFADRRPKTGLESGGESKSGATFYNRSSKYKMPTGLSFQDYVQFIMDLLSAHLMANGRIVGASLTTGKFEKEKKADSLVISLTPAGDMSPLNALSMIEGVAAEMLYNIHRSVEWQVVGRSGPLDIVFSFTTSQPGAYPVVKTFFEFELLQLTYNHPGDRLVNESWTQKSSDWYGLSGKPCEPDLTELPVGMSPKTFVETLFFRLMSHLTPAIVASGEMSQSEISDKKVRWAIRLHPVFKK